MEEDIVRTQRKSWSELQPSHILQRVLKTGALALLGVLSIGVALGLSMQNVQVAAAEMDQCASVESVSQQQHLLDQHAQSSQHSSRNQLVCHNNGKTAPYQNGFLKAADAEEGVDNAWKEENVQPHLQSLSLQHNRGGPQHPSFINELPWFDSDDEIDYNSFPYGTCTWYANKRFHDLYGYYVPWSHGGAMAWQWADRAADLGWNVSSAPTEGAIIVLQGGVQGSGGAGHVGVVERVLDDGSVIASSMNWQPNPRAVSYQHYYPGRGVSFVSPQ
jgi:surface antigen